LKLEPSRLMEKEFWLSIVPGLHLNDKKFLAECSALVFNSEELELIKRDLLEDGYFQVDPQQWGFSIPLMAEAVTRFSDMAWPTVLAMIYDEFFVLPYCISNLLNSVLGKDFKQLPDFWVWYVDPLRAKSGWKSHRDKGIESLMKDRSPKSLSVWIPLTNAEPKNGCMYILPAKYDPYFANPKEKDFDSSNIMALPAEAGSILGWNQAVLHWGGRSSRKAKIPRISVAFEFQRGDVEPYNQPLFSVYPIADLKFRLKLIGKQILQYQHMYPLTDEISKLAMNMIDAAG